MPKRTSCSGKIRTSKGSSWVGLVLIVALMISSCGYKTIYDSSTPLKANQIRKGDHLRIVEQDGEELLLVVSSFDGRMIYGGVIRGSTDYGRKEFPLQTALSIERKR